ncbi:fatty acyl-AMP ligase [Streptomyces radicis]|uniref:Fatty acyl-AMP ligase n=1 Tax=Streptomyces radicis TaxID=1750517 RepID=A0A3A9WTJ6_9ACTN|nr:fatty acyl-AMP ligase [Streptomyces radicis]RKN12864.1 fatty acyl-AMP ligase [Streptomyces radicis]RKN27371.1 fatty acyl-AMP ligase [Streptomyces radicis]
MVQSTSLTPARSESAPPAEDEPRWLTLIDMCRARAADETDRKYFSFLEHGEEESDFLTPGEVDRLARAIAVTLLEHAPAGSRVLLNYPPGLAFVPAFFGCLYAGMIAVPIPPVEAGRDGAKTSRLEAVTASSEPAVLLSTAATLAKLEASQAVAEALSGVARLATDTVDPEAGAAWTAPDVDGDTVAYLQYSSGSTGLPKGVMLTHANVLDNLALIHENGSRGELPEGSAPPPVVLWLPLFHDMGLVNGILQPLFAGYEVTLMPPLAFVQHPFNWLRAISDRGEAISVAPNFAYELCVRRVSDAQAATLDLSGWKLAAVGAEPVRPDTLDRFVEKFGPAGFHRETFFPCYGLAESTVMVSGGPATEEPVVRSFDAAALVAGKLRPAAPGARARRLVGCGQIQPSLTLRLVDPVTGELCADDEIGEVYVSGHSVGTGYWNAPDLTDDTFRARLPDAPELRFLRTGDLGFLHEGQLFITGRRKDVIILDGLNYYPHDIEESVSRCHHALRQDRVCAFSVDDGGREKLVVLVEIERRHRVLRAGETADGGGPGARNAVAASEIEAAVRRAVAADHAIRVADTLLLRPGILPYTSSAKIKRAECRERYAAGKFDADHLA